MPAGLVDLLESSRGVRPGGDEDRLEVSDEASASLTVLTHALGATVANAALEKFSSLTRSLSAQLERLLTRCHGFSIQRAKAAAHGKNIMS
eukprot:763956-Hanusia_phi.AAC.1